MQIMKSRSAGIKIFPYLQYNILNIYPQYFVINVQLWTIILFKVCAEDHSPTCRTASKSKEAIKYNVGKTFLLSLFR